MGGICLETLVQSNQCLKCLRQINAATAGRSSFLIEESEHGGLDQLVLTGPQTLGAGLRIQLLLLGVVVVVSCHPSLFQINTFDKNTTSLFIIIPPLCLFFFYVPPPPPSPPHMALCGWKKRVGGLGAGRWVHDRWEWGGGVAHKRNEPTKRFTLTHFIRSRVGIGVACVADNPVNLFVGSNPSLLSNFRSWLTRICIRWCSRRCWKLVHFDFRTILIWLFIDCMTDVWNRAAKNK